MSAAAQTPPPRERTVLLPMNDNPPSPARAASVLVVEDDAALREMFIALLTHNGFKVECVPDGSAALEKLDGDHDYSVMLLDLMMPGTNGYDVLAQLRTTQPALLRQTIVTTGVSQRDLRRIDPQAVFAVLRKPFDMERLVSTINDCASQSRKNRSRRTRRSTGGDGDDDAETNFDASLRRFASALPELRKLLSQATCSDRELMLRNELRRVVGEVATILSGRESSRCSSVARAARHLAGAPIIKRRHTDH